MIYEYKTKEQLINEVIELRKRTKQYEEAIRISEYNYRTVLENTHEPIYVAQNGMIKYANKMTIQTSGYSEEELISRPFIDFIHPDDREYVMSRHVKRLKGENPTNFYQYRLIDKYGNTRWMELKVTRIIWNGKPATLNFINDITEQKQAQEALRLSEERFYKAFKFNPASMVVTSFDGRFIDINDAMLNYLCYERNEVIGKRIKTMNVFVDEDNLKYILMCGINNKTISNMEIHLRTKLGKTHIGLLSTEIIDVVGEKCILGVVQDITERKHIEEELRKANNKISSILESITDAFYTMDKNWTITYMNSTAEKIVSRIIGRKKGSSVGKNRWELLPLYVGTNLYYQYHKAMAEQIPVCFEVISPYTKLYYEFNAYPSAEGLSVYFRDITERKKMEEKIRLSEERFFTAFNYSPVAMTIYSLDRGKFIDANESCLKIDGYSRDEFIGRTVLDLNLWVDMRECDKFVRELNEKGFAYNHEIRSYKKSGEIFTALLSGVVIDLNGEKCVLVTKNDITELRQYQKEMARLAKLNLIGEMAAGIAHEIRNPMTTVRGFLQILGQKERYHQDKEHFSLMIEELNRVNSIITEFLSLAKNRVVAFKMEKLNNILNSFFPLIQADAMVSDKYVTLELNEIPNLLLDEKEIRQLVLNLSRNGLEAMPSGECMTISTYVESDEVILLVKDRGQGIPADILDKIGTPFFTTKDNGTGLGLATCYSIAARHNARIDFDTGPEGTTFYVKFKIST